jgi:hypothetical protein
MKVEVFEMIERKVYPGDPIRNMILTKGDWEKLMVCLDEGVFHGHKQSVYMKYMLQCMINTAISRGEWL